MKTCKEIYEALLAQSKSKRFRKLHLYQVFMSAEANAAATTVRDTEAFYCAALGSISLTGHFTEPDNTAVRQWFAKHGFDW